jgi:uncharacterized protein (DUF433 family)
MSAVAQSLIEIDEGGVAWISDTKVKVIEVALDKLVHGSSPEDIHFQYPHLSIAQVYAALAYYYEHQNELDSEIQRRWHEVNEMAALEATRPLQERLRKFRRGPIIESLLVPIHPQ